ncbi:MAG TPA: protein kinase [Thermoanaerobaculia bacterium]|nr:protein kinase [Thermoanaerobaculia bacterium]
MTLATGTRLGPYEIAVPLGAGGMGEVYRAKDTRLDRSVAIKVLPAHLSSDPELRARMTREARAVSALNHPHICALYDVGSADGTDYIVMELLEGETLADRLSKGPLPTDLVLRWGIEIAEALDKAHKQGIVHRDLKPGNVMLTKSGVKLLDFGLAKLRAEEAGEPALSSLPTRLASKPLTEKGTVLGTFQYMAPEQLEGRDADPRSDIFALGAVLYEMATGRRAFEGRSRASLIAAILSSEPPPISTIQRMAPPALDRLVKTCLAKEPDERWQSAHDVASELKWIAEGGSSVGAPAVVAGKRKSRERIAWGVAAAMTLAAAALATRSLSKTALRERVLKFSSPLGAGQALPRTTLPYLAFSPDGSRLVYSMRDVRYDNSELSVRELDRLEPTKLAGTVDGVAPFFSPDGAWIAFYADNKLQRMAASGGGPIVLCDAPHFSGADWSADGSIYFSSDPDSGSTGSITRVSASGGKAQRLFSPDPKRGERALLWPQALPGGKALLCTVWTGGRIEDSRIAVQPLNGKERRIVYEGASLARWVPSGHLVFAHGGTLLAAPFDLDKLALLAPPQPVVEGVLNSVDNGAAQFTTSANGSLAYVPGAASEADRSLVWVDRKGAVQLVVPASRPYADARLSPDGRTAAFTLQGATYDVWTLDLARGSLTRISLGSDDTQPAFTPDGARIVYSSTRSGRPNLYWRSADASDAEERLTESAHSQSADCVTPDGSALLIDEMDPVTQSDVFLVPLTGDHKPRPLLKTPFSDVGARVSPDGRYIAYVSNESGRNEVYVRPFPGLTRKWQVSTNGGELVRWAASGKEIFYLDRPTGRYYAVPVALEPFTLGTPVLMFEGRYNGRFDPAPDGQRFLMIRDNDERPRVEIRFVLNWLEELKRKVPAR